MPEPVEDFEKGKWIKVKWLGIRMICLSSSCGFTFRVPIDTDINDLTLGLECPRCRCKDVEEAR